MKKISGAEYPLSKIFSSEFEFTIPPYQRPYAWTVDQVSDLFEDLVAFEQAEPEDGYFLGSIVLIKDEGQAPAEVIDGQQRLTSLTILLAAAAAAHNGAVLETARPYIIEPGKVLEGIESKPRLTLRERDRAFFAKYVQGFAFKSLFEIDASKLDNESQQNIAKNAFYLLNEIEKRLPTAEDVSRFIRFLLTRCYLVAVSTSSPESAFRVFSVMNSRGLDLQTTDIVKADLIGDMSNEKDRNKYNEIWEDMEVALSRAGFNELFSHIRMIYAKEKAKRNLLEEFKQHVRPKHQDPRSFIDDVLKPYADALIAIKAANYSSASQADEINAYLKWLNRIDNWDWVPPAMAFMAKYQHKPALLAQFFKLLERLAAYIHLSGSNVNERIEIYSDLLTEIEKFTSIDDLHQLHFSSEDVENFKEVLDGQVYYMKPRRRNYLMLRLDSFISDGAATYDPKLLTIEHVLPQTVAEESEWAKWWPDGELRSQWVHRLANLVPLNKQRNSAASNYDFAKKRDVYFKGYNNVSSYALTTHVLSVDEWKYEDVSERQRQLIDSMLAGWELA